MAMLPLFSGKLRVGDAVDATFGRLTLRPLDDRRCAVCVGALPGPLHQVAVLFGQPLFASSDRDLSVSCPSFFFAFDSSYEYVTFLHAVKEVGRMFGVHMMKETLEKDIGMAVDVLQDYSPAGVLAEGLGSGAGGEDCSAAGLGGAFTSTLAAARGGGAGGGSAGAGLGAAGVPGGGPALLSSQHTAAAQAAAAAKARTAALLRSCAGVPMPLTDCLVYENCLPKGAAPLRPLLLAPPAAPGAALSPSSSSSSSGTILEAASGAYPSSSYPLGAAAQDKGAAAAAATAPAAALCVLQPVDALFSSSSSSSSSSTLEDECALSGGSIRIATSLRALAVEFSDKYCKEGMGRALDLMGRGEFKGELWHTQRWTPESVIETAVRQARAAAASGAAGGGTAGGISITSKASLPTSSGSLGGLQIVPSYLLSPSGPSPSIRKRCSLCDATEAKSSTRRNLVWMHGLVPVNSSTAPVWSCEACWRLILARRLASLEKGVLLGPDGHEELCACCARGISGEGLTETSMILCSARRCPRAYCKDCLTMILLPSAGDVRAVLEAEEWLCPPCAAVSKEVIEVGMATEFSLSSGAASGSGAGEGVCGGGARDGGLLPGATGSEDGGEGDGSSSSSSAGAGKRGGAGAGAGKAARGGGGDNASSSSSGGGGHARCGTAVAAAAAAAGSPLSTATSPTAPPPVAPSSPTPAPSHQPRKSFGGKQPRSSHQLIPPLPTKAASMAAPAAVPSPAPPALAPAPPAAPLPRLKLVKEKSSSNASEGNSITGRANSSSSSSSSNASAGKGSGGGGEGAGKGSPQPQPPLQAEGGAGLPKKRQHHSQQLTDSATPAASGAKSSNPEGERAGGGSKRVRTEASKTPGNGSSSSSSSSSGSGSSSSSGSGSSSGGGAPAPSLPPVLPSFDPLPYFASYATRVRARGENWGAYLPTEDDCFACRDGGEVAECDYKGPGCPQACSKVYHPECIAGGIPQEEGKWRCPRHVCSACLDTAHVSCRYCPLSWCSKHAMGEVQGGGIHRLPREHGASARINVPGPFGALLEAEAAAAAEAAAEAAAAAAAGAGAGAGAAGACAPAAAAGRGRRVAPPEAAAATPASPTPTSPAAAAPAGGSTTSTALATANARIPLRTALRTPDIALHITLVLCAQCKRYRDECIAKGLLAVDPMEGGEGGEGGTSLGAIAAAAMEAQGSGEGGAGGAGAGAGAGRAGRGAAAPAAQAPGSGAAPTAAGQEDPDGFAVWLANSE
jgi:hypothetical protein